MALPEAGHVPCDERKTRTPSVVAGMTQWELALQSVSHLATVFALSLAFILVLAHQVLSRG